MNRPRLLITMGDVAVIGPEIIARAWPELLEICRPEVVGDPVWLCRSLALRNIEASVQEIHRPGEVEPSVRRVPCLRASDQNLDPVTPGRVSAAAGRAAYDYLCAAIDW